MGRRILPLVAGLVLTLVMLAAPGLAGQTLSTTGAAPVAEPPSEPLRVGVGIKIDQITGVDQRSENYGAVVSLQMIWEAPELAFDSAVEGGEVKVMPPDDLIDLAGKRGAPVPFFVVQNQQSNRWIHQAVVAIESGGRVRYVEKSSLTLQAPYFNFRRYPFDTQTFFFEIVSVYPSQWVHFYPLEDVSGLGDTLGEEEWVFGKARMQLSSEPGLSGQDSDRIALRFEAHRHIQYYALRIFLPMLILIVVGWSSFFLEDYRKRIEIAGANLLVFVAFNWAISADLPKLGYVTFLDFLLQCVFLVTGAIVVFNVILSRLEVKGRARAAALADKYVVKWIYPFGYAGVVLFAVYYYLWTG